MVSDTQLNHQLAETARLREQAGELLNRLQTDRERSEQRFAELGKRDPMKAITGRTALENAIASTREMIQHMDALLLEMGVELDQLDALAHSQEPVAAPASRPTSANPIVFQPMPRSAAPTATAAS